MLELVLLPHDVLDVVDVGEVNPHGLVELLGSFGQRLSPQLSEQVAEVVAPMEDDPLDAFIEDQT